MILKNRKISRFIHQFFLSLLTLSFTSCQFTTCELTSSINCPVTLSAVTQPSAFPCLTSEEQNTDWGKELIIGDTFAREWDLYRAITSYKRALVFLHENCNDRRLQIYYDIIFCYYLGNKYAEAIAIFEDSPLTTVTTKFPAFDQLLLIMYDCYLQVDQETKAQHFLDKIEKLSPQTSLDLSIYENLKEARIDETEECIAQHPDFCTMQPELDLYHYYAKSPTTARQLNALLPGAGYYYVGQKKAALTSFIINSLFILATYECFKHGYPAAGLITASLETGWYLGGINGAGIEAQEFNNRLFDGIGTKLLKNYRCFPVLMFETSF